MSHPTGPRQQLPARARRAVTAMYVGLACSVIGALVVLADQVWGGLLATHSHEIYPRAGAAELRDVNTMLRTYLYCVSACGVGCWLWMVWAVKRHKRWARTVTTTVFALATAIALFDLLVEEYGNRLLPTLLGLAGVLPCLAGAVTIVLLWSSGSRWADRRQAMPDRWSDRQERAPYGPQR